MSMQTIPLPPLKEILNATELSAYLSSKLCHDLISPVSALNNAIELSEEEGFEADIVELLKQSAIKASHKLQFYRLAFGAYGDVQSPVNLLEAKKAASAYMEHEKAQLIWRNIPDYLPKLATKLLLNLICVANKMLSRGGEITINFENPARIHGVKAFELQIHDKPLQASSQITAIALGQLKPSELNAQNIQIYYSLLLAQQAGMALTLKQDEQQLNIAAIHN